MKTKKLLQSGILYTLGNLLVQGMAFITLPIYTRIISQEVYGQFNLYNSWIAIISLFIGLQLSGSLSVAKKKYVDSYDDYSVTILTGSNIFFIFFFLIGLLIKDYLSTLFNVSSTLVIVIIIQSYLGYTSGFLANYFIQLQKSTFNFFLSLFLAIFNTILSITLIYIMQDDLLARILGGLFPSLIAAIISFLYFYKKKNIVYKNEYLIFGLSMSIPLIFHHLGHNILNQFDRIMIGKMMTFKDVALYSFGYNLGLIMQIVLLSLNTAWVPWFFESRKKKYERLPYFISRYLNLGLFLTLGYLTVFPEFALLMGGDRYRESIHFISLIIISSFYVFLYTFPVNIQFYYENTKFIPLGTILAGLLNIVLNFIFINKLGIYGAAIATAISYLLLLILHHLISKKIYNYNDVRGKTFFVLVVVSIIYTLIINYFLSNWIIRYGLGLIVLIIYTYYYKEELLNIIKKYKNSNIK